MCFQETVDIVDVEEGTGAEAGVGSCCTMSYTGTLHSDGSKFDSAAKFRLVVFVKFVYKRISSLFLPQ